MHASHKDDVLRLWEVAVSGDQMHVRIHAKSLAALESDDEQEIEETKFVLRKLVAAGEHNSELQEMLRELQR